MRLLLFIAGLLLASSASTQDAALYQNRRATADGIGKVYMGREISQVMGWQGAAWLEREEREREERTDLLLPALDLKPGMAVADIGAGSGYFARRIAAVVGGKGSVYAVDVQRRWCACSKRWRSSRGSPTSGRFLALSPM